ncbi:MAG: hypothetical protein HY268_09645, partial [Deltaproteobacteria bacterium]|nr:hypothetical protein [Deltaproteobacteria bacterium]
MASVCIRVGVLFLVVASLSSREFLPRPVPPLPAVARQPESDPLTESNPLTESSPLTVADLQRRGTITFLMHHSAASSFLYRGEQMGFEYELALAFAKELGVELQVLTPPPDVELTSWLKTGKGDVIAGLFTDGAGHVEDAQRLARVLGYDPHCWEESMES